jgi:alkylation response protein AidB-like acyl-CoA dehydrogenase
MEFALTEDQRFIQESAQGFLSEAAGPEALRAVVEGGAGWDRALWASLAGEMGFAGLMVPEALGGSGLGAVEMALVLGETGRTLAAIPFFETAVLAVQAILAAGSPRQQAELLGPIARGEVKASFAGTAARPSLSGGRLAGTATFVTFGHIADLLIVATSDDSLIALPADHQGVVIERIPNLDRTRPFAAVAFDCDVPESAVLGAPGGAASAIRRTLAIGAGLLASEQTGGAQYCLDSTVDYAKQRVQFGRLIGSFQAVKHELADMMVMIEASRSAALYAAAAIDEDAGELEEACAIAASWASECYRHCSSEAIQLHGGIGFTWEHHAHLYFKRARASSTWLGTPEEHRETIARIMGLDNPAETI